MAAEPLPPAGIDPARLMTALTGAFGQAGQDLYEWFAVEHPVWGRELANRITTAQDKCKKAEAQP